jgi:hypothetical protein
MNNARLHNGKWLDTRARKGGFEIMWKEDLVALVVLVSWFMALAIASGRF